MTTYRQIWDLDVLFEGGSQSPALLRVIATMEESLIELRRLTEALPDPGAPTASTAGRPCWSTATRWPDATPRCGTLCSVWSRKTCTTRAPGRSDTAWSFSEASWQVRSLTAEPVTAGGKDFVHGAVREWQRRNPPHRTGKLLGGLALMGFGLLSVIKPRTVWYWSEGWKFRDAEPSDAAILLTVISGVAAVVIGLIVAATW